MNFYYPDDNSVIISTDEITTIKEINTIVEIFAKAASKDPVKDKHFMATANVLMKSSSGNLPF